MDGTRFDTLARSLGTQSARRGMFKAAAGGVLGLVGLSALSDGALARYCDKDRDCRGNDVCYRSRNRCVECVRNKDCGPDQRCTNNNNCKDRN
jgi:hypothetical protein